ncbi:MAG: response regulator [Steroidobacteraceae bacterium]|jgi:FixJ family two-component response regulator|nr:response regulator [Steroidobacteraceae bacterium]
MSETRAPLPDATIFLVDDDASIRDSLALLLSLRGLRTQLFANAEAFLATYRPEWRGVLLTDLRMPGLSGLELYAQLRAKGCDLPVVVLTAHGDVATTRAAMKAGAFDFLEKPVDEDVLIDVLTNAIREDASRHAVANAATAARDRLQRLTPREAEVLRLLADGLQHREVAERLSISPRTVEVYKARMMEKLQCRSLAEVVRLAIESAPGRNDEA